MEKKYTTKEMDLTKNKSLKNLTRKRDLTKKSLKILPGKAGKGSPGKEISQRKMKKPYQEEKSWKILTRKRVSKTARQRRMLMKLGFRSIFCFFVNTKKQMMLPDNIY